MSSPQTSSRRSSGYRRISAAMLAARDRADSFAGLPHGTAKPLRFLAAFERARPCLGLSAAAYTLVSWLVSLTRPQDWEEGSRPVAWPSARREAQHLGLSITQVKALNRRLYEAGIFVIRDNAQGQRSGQRGPDGRIAVAFGFDLSPLAQRYDEFVRLAAEAMIEDRHMKALRRRVTLAYKAVQQAGERLAALERLPDEWQRIETEAAHLVGTARRVERSEDLAFVVTGLERRKAEAEQAIALVETVKTDPSVSQYRPPHTATNLADNPSDTGAAQEASGPVPPSAALPCPPASAPERPPVPTKPTIGAEQEIRLKPAQLLDLAPRLLRYMSDATPTWTTIADAAGGSLRHELGVSPSLWGEACVAMGREQAALALAIVSTKAPGHFTRGAGGYFAGMVRKAARGELRLDRSIWALRQAKWGKVDMRRAQ